MVDRSLPELAKPFSKGDVVSEHKLVRRNWVVQLAC